MRVRWAGSQIFVVAALLLCVLPVCIIACGNEPVTIKPPPVFPTPTATPSATSTGASQVEPTPSPTYTWSPQIVDYIEIRRIKYLGDEPFTEADEYVSIKNYGDQSVNLLGWVLIDATDGYPWFTFPHFILHPDDSCRVYTNQHHLEWGGLEFDWEEPIWNNSHPDVAQLYDSRGNLIAEKSYTVD
jgi:hypothetical protein